MVSKVIKIQIIKPLDSTWNEFSGVLRDIQYQTWKFSNKAIQMFWDYSNFNQSYKNRFGEYINKFEDVKSPKRNGKGYYKNIESDIVNQLLNESNKICSSGVNATIKMVKEKWFNDFSDIVNGRKSIANFKRDMPIELHKNQMVEENRKELMLKKSHNKENKTKYDQYTMSFQLINKKYATELGRKNGWFNAAVAVKDNYQKAIVDRVINGEYKLSMSRITFNKGKWFWNMCYTFTPEKEEWLNKNKIMGIDLGVNIPAMLAIDNDNYYRQSVGDGQEIINFQNQVKERKRRLQQSRKWAGKGGVGHGVKTRIKPLEKLSGKIANFKNTKNHAWSRYIVDEAVRNKCGVIQMEDLTGIADNSSFLKTWTFYDLQQKIEYKAKEKGIKVKKIDPKYTSQRCNKCGFIHKENRNVEKYGQEYFKCSNCNHETNADFNAAKNIAMKDIEKIIKEQLESQEKYYKNQMKYTMQ